MGVEWRRRKYLGVSVATRTKAGKWARKTFCGPKEDFHRHLMDAKVHIIQQGLLGMSSSSVDDFVCDEKGWAWCENEVVGAYVVPEKERGSRWHEFRKLAKGSRTRRAPMWVLNGGKVVVVQDRAPDAACLPVRAPGRWKVMHADAEEAVMVHAGSVEGVLVKAEKAKARSSLEF